MSVTCPACGKADQEQLTCSRCGCDLSRLIEVARAAAAAFHRSLACLRAGRRADALAAAEQSWRLCHSVEAARLAFLAAAALGDTSSALSWRRIASSSQEN
jgi:hypothetical protein